MASIEGLSACSKQLLLHVTPVLLAFGHAYPEMAACVGSLLQSVFQVGSVSVLLAVYMMKKDIIYTGDNYHNLNVITNTV